MRDKTLLGILGIGVLAAGIVTLIYKGPDFFQNPAQKKPSVVVIFKMNDANSTFWSVVRDGVESAATDLKLDVDIRSPLTETDIDRQIEILEKAIAEKPSAIVLAAGDYYRLVPAVRLAKDKGIPLVTIDSFINSEDALAKIGTDNVEAGRKCALALLKYLGGGSQVAIMSYIKGSSTAIDREIGVRMGLEGKVELLETRFSDGEADIAYKQTKQLLDRYPRLKGIVALNEPTTLGVAKALKESGKAKSIALVGVDNTFAVMKYIEEGILRDAIVQQPFNMGYLGLSTVAKILEGKQIERTIDTGSVDIYRENMFLPQNQKLLFPLQARK